MVNMIDKAAIASAGLWLLQSDHQKQMNDSPGMSTPEWMVKIGTDGFPNGSTIGNDDSDYTSCIELLKWDACAGRDMRGLTGSQMISSASLKHSNVEIHIPVGSYVPTLEKSMYMGEYIDIITFYRLTTFSKIGLLQEMQTIEFEQCFINSLEQMGDTLKLEFRFTYKTSYYYGYGQDGEALGANVSTVDFETGVAETEAAG